MGERVMADIPQWAKERAIELADAEDWEKVPALATAFARYIAEHEDPPVDPLVAALSPMCGFVWFDVNQLAERLNESLAERGLEIREVQP
jgi:hypothetical protein